MKKTARSSRVSSFALDLFRPRPGALYSLDVTARLTGISRRTIMIYCRAGLIKPIVQPPHGIIVFPEEAIYMLRSVEYLRSVHGLDLVWIKTLFDLNNEVERLRAEIRFLRNQR